MPDETRKSPAFQFYPKDFLSDEKQISMSLPAVGIYMRLICHCWNQGSLPADAASLARLSGATKRQMHDLWPSIAPCFRTNAEGRLIHPRLEREKEKQLTYRQRQSDAGRASAAMKSALTNQRTHVELQNTEKLMIVPSGIGDPPLNGAISQIPSNSDGHAQPRLDSGCLPVVTKTQPQLNSSSSSAVCSLQTPVSQSDSPPLDEAYSRFQGAYPAERRQGGFMAEQAFMAAVNRMGGVPLLMARLEQHKRSEEWAIKKLVPGMQKWLMDELFLRELGAPKGDAAGDDLAAKALKRIESDQARYGGLKR